MKVGLTMDMAPAHRAGTVGEYIKRKYDEGRLVIEFIDGGLTSVLQVCDLAANKEFKATIKKLYIKWRGEYIRAQRQLTPNEPNKRIKIKIVIVKMTEIVEEAVRIFNAGQRTSRSIEKTFRSAGQDPWVNCEKEFKAHLDALAKLPLRSIMEKSIAARTAKKLPGGDDGIEFK